VVAGTHLEIERKFDVDTAFELPPLAGVPGVAATDEPEEHRLEAVYHDTADLRLMRSKVTLRRRTGGADAGWHLKLPAPAGGRRERQEPLGRAVKAPPKPLRELITGLVRGAATGPVATLKTRRIVTVLRDDAGRALAEVADDTVTATTYTARPGEPAEALEWREVEVELAEGVDDESLLVVVGDALVAAGARPSASASKLGRVLATRLAAADDQVEGSAGLHRPAMDGAASGKKARKAAKHAAEQGASGADVVLAAVRAQLDALLEADLMIRTDQPDAVHRFRVACRRLRSILAAFRPVLDREATDPLRAELKWLGEQLSDARDDEVALEHLRALLAGQPEELVLGAVAARLQQTELREVQRGAEAARRTLTDRRYVQVLDHLHGLLADPPLADGAGERAAEVLRDGIRRSGKRLLHRIDDARQAAPEDVGHALHEARKAAKRVRYTAEVAVGELGSPAEALVECMKQVQDGLGERQDTAITRDYCRRLGLEAFAAGENPWTFGRLDALEEARAERATAAFWELEPALHPLLRKARKKG
jgi:CHAD domain-containing protein